MAAFEAFGGVPWRRKKTTPNLQAVTVTALGRATRAESDEQLLESWLARLRGAKATRYALCLRRAQRDPRIRSMHIEILTDVIKGRFRVRVVDADGRTVRMFTYPTIESARRAASAWTVAHGNCPIVDKSGIKK